MPPKRGRKPAAKSRKADTTPSPTKRKKSKKSAEISQESPARRTRSTQKVFSDEDDGKDVKAMEQEAAVKDEEKIEQTIMEEEDHVSELNANGSSLIGNSSGTSSANGSKSKIVRGRKKGTSTATRKKQTRSSDLISANSTSIIPEEDDKKKEPEKEKGKKENTEKAGSKTDNGPIWNAATLLEKLLASSLTEKTDDKKKKNIALVDTLLNNLSGTRNEIFESYKKSMEKKNAISNDLVNLLVKKVSTLEDTKSSSSNDSADKQIQQLMKENQELRNKLENAQGSKNSGKLPDDKYKSITSRLERSVEKFEIISDIMESICGIRINDVDDSDSNNLVFNCVQGGLNGQINYQLILSRSSVSDTEEVLSPENEDDADVEMIYNPLNTEDESMAELKTILPDYFFESLTFPVETLPQFYQKLSRALNKEQRRET